MDKKTVFVKTRDGEEAMRQRTRLVQRNLRNILIMVDGHASVADLAKRFGDEATTEAALRELLAGGFIAESASQLDFTTPQPAEASGEQSEEVPVLTSQVVPPALPEAPPDPAPAPAPVIEEIVLNAPEYESLPPPSVRPVAAPRAETRAAASGASLADRIKALLAGKEGKPPVAAKKKAAEVENEDEPIGGVELKPIRRGGLSDVGWPVLALSAFIGIAVLLALTLLLYPYGRHLPDIERNASAMLQDPVKVGDIGFSFLPRPHIVLRNVTVGKEAHLTIGSVRAVPDFLSLMGERKAFHELALEKVAVKDSGLGRLALASAAGASVSIQHITLDDVSLTAGDARLGGIGGEVKLTAAGGVEAIALHNADRTLKVDLQPQGEAYRISATGENWKSPGKPSLTFQWIELQGELRPSRLELSKIGGKAYDGLIEGKAALGWIGGASFSGDLELKRMNPAKLLNALGAELSAEGELTARLKLSAKADSLGKLSEALSAGGTFDMKRGAAKGFDLGEAVRNTGREPTRGGETKFEQFGGTFEYGQGDARLGNLRLASGLLTAAGNLGIARNGKLNGTMNVELRSSAATLRMPLAVGGTTKDPMLTPSRR